MRKAFTLIELLVVVVVIVTLMAITFRLGSVGSDTTSRSETINKMQRIENCLSGYYAAYGSYPPVHLHGSRDYTYNADMHGIQQVDPESKSTELKWHNVEAACRSQPLGMLYPFSNPDAAKYVEAVAKIHMQRANSSDPKYSVYQNNLALRDGYQALVDNTLVSGKARKQDWADVQVFKFGLLSYLLPRYLIMMNVSKSSNLSGLQNVLANQDQWNFNNNLPCDFDSGEPYKSWSAVLDDIKSERWKIAVLPSQSVCARWIQNLEGVVAAQFVQEIFGVDLQDKRHSGNTGVNIENPYPPIFSGGDSQTGADSGSGSSSSQYVLDGMTIKDGWGHELYYYSPAPHQSYVLWSAGSNGKTFPPWISDEERKSKLKADEFKTVETWIADDIVSMRN